MWDLKRVLTENQKNEAMALSELVKTPWRQILDKFMRESIKKREDILLGRDKWADNRELDKVQYTKNTILREELNILYWIADYPTKIVNTFGVYEEVK